MDCRAALEILDVVRPDSADRTEPEVASAAAHAEDCPRCEERFRSRQEFDRRIGRQMRAVPVPSDLRSRLLAAIRDADVPTGGSELPAVVPAEPIATRRERGRRRARLVAIASTALCLMAAVTIFVAQMSTAARWTLAELQREARGAWEQADQLPRFQGTFQPLLPEFGWQTSRSIHLAQEPHGFPPGTVPHPAAVYEFVLAGPRPVRGILLVTKTEFVANPPESQAFNARGVGSGPMGVVSWTEGDLVYVCVISGGGNSLDRLHNAIRHAQAA